MRTNSLLPDPRDEAEIERLENLLCDLRKAVREAAAHLKGGRSPEMVAMRLAEALAASDPSRKES